MTALSHSDSSSSLLHLVVPAYNPGEEFDAFLPALAAQLEDAGLPHRIVVVDDGSDAASRERIERVVGTVRSGHASVLPPLRQAQNRGKGAAIMLGWETAPANASRLGFVDADGSVPADEVVRVLAETACMMEPELCVIASRLRILGRTIERHWHRHLVGRVFASLTTLALGIRAYDTQCGFKVVPTQAYQAVRPWIREQRFSFDVELVALLLQAGFPVREVGIDWADRGRSTVRLWRDIPAMALSLLRIRARQKRWARTLRAGPSSLAPSRRA